MAVTSILKCTVFECVGRKKRTKVMLWHRCKMEEQYSRNEYNELRQNTGLDRRMVRTRFQKPASKGRKRTPRLAACVIGPAPFLERPIISSYIYYTLVCGQRRAAPAAILLSLLTGSVSQSVTNSQRDQSTPVVVESGRSLAAGRYVVVANKLLTL